MAMGVNLQWGYAGLFNVGVMGFAAVGGLAEKEDREVLLASFEAAKAHVDRARLVEMAQTLEGRNHTPPTTRPNSVVVPTVAVAASVCTLTCAVRCTRRS